MNKTIRKALLAVMLSVLTAAMTACGSAAEQISGDWTVKTVNGKTPSDFASDNGVFELGTAKNYHFTDKDVTVSAVDETGAVISKTFDTKPTDNGLEILASGSTIMLEYIEADNQILYPEVKFFKELRKSLPITDDEILEKFPDKEDYLLPDINTPDFDFDSSINFEPINFSLEDDKTEE